MQVHQCVESLDFLQRVIGQVKLLELSQGLEAADLLDAVALEPQCVKVRIRLQTLNLVESYKSLCVK